MIRCSTWPVMVVVITTGVEVRGNREGEGQGEKEGGKEGGRERRLGWQH